MSTEKKKITLILWRNAIMKRTFISIVRKNLVARITAIIILAGLLFSTQAWSNTDGLVSFLAGNSQQSENVINVRLIGANDYELVDVFGKVLNKSQGVLEAKRHGSRIVPDNPRACFAVWAVRIHEPDLSRLQSNIIKAIRDIRDEANLLKKIHPGNITAAEVQFVVY
jgi:hypothetical protein